MKEYTIKITCNEVFYRALVTMLRYAKKLGQNGMSRKIAIYFDGDGSDKIHDMLISDAVEPTNKGILTSASWATDWSASWHTGDFLLDTDEVWDF